MKKHYFKTAGIFIISLFCSLSFGQVKQITPPNIKSPFQSQSKKVIGNNAVIVPSSQSAKTAKPSTEKLKTINGSFMLDFKNPNNSKTSRTKESRTSSVVSNEFGTWFGLNGDHTFQLISEKEDDLKTTHSYYQQYYKGFLVEGSVLMLHSKEGIVNAANGQVAEFASMQTQVAILKEEAKNIAKLFFKVTNVLNEYPVETVICRVPSENGFDFAFTHKIRIDSSSPFVMSNVYVDAKTGKVINSISLIADIDTPATAKTLYSGTQSITTDSYNGGYRLIDNARKIETYDATSASDTQDPILFSNPTTNWGFLPILQSISISTVSQNWWYSTLIDTSPDLYIIVKDASNKVIYNGRNFYKNDILPTLASPIVFSLNILMENQPYSIEVWDFDTVGGDDFGGSYTISSTTGIWSGNGNIGAYSIITSVNNPALDVHWGMEKTYDFYKNVFGRNSFDGKGATIKSYINAPDTQIQRNEDPNNAYAAPAPFNFMVYGLGDGKYMNPVVSLDAAAHEFTHLVINNNGNGGLVYQGESGALNESFADIFGTAIEFYAKPLTANWSLGESVFIPAPFLRSLDTPRINSLKFIFDGVPIDLRQPNAYKKDFWFPTTDKKDNGGVHRNSGVQNYWFYLLCQGGSGTINDDGIASYSVAGIGIAKAREIAYKNLIFHLGEYATYADAYYGSLIAAEELYPTVGGVHSQEYNSVRQAWYAVGIGDDPNNDCSGTTNLTAATDTFTDGSGTANYGSNANCKWVIAPAGATQVSIKFSKFDTEATYDKVYIYDGSDDTAPLLATFSGNTLPPTITTTAGVGAMCIKFTSDASTNLSGWSADYNAIIVSPTCSGGTLLTTPTGTFTDGSDSGNYTNNQQCYWYIAPPCATSVTLSFSQFNTELNYDGIVVYDSLDATNKIGAFSGTTVPASLTSPTGTMLVVFISDYANVLQGFTANYTSTGSSYCSGVTTVNTSDYGTITDGSGANNYCNNSNCSWLIQPPQATTITFNFTEFELESPSPDKNSVYDVVEIYDGTSASAPLLKTFYGKYIPAPITSSSGSMFIRFYSDGSSNFKGWSGNYTSTQNGYCNSSTSTLTAQTGTFSDGSGADKYSNNSDCSWLIQPTNASSITLSFSEFDTELNYDGVIVFDGANNSAPILGKFTGTSIPSPVTSTGGSMYVSFLSDESERSNGWSANYTSTNSPSPTTFNLDRKLIDAAGATQTSGTSIITWSLGEPIIGNMNNGNVKLTNGFHPLLNSQILEIQDNSTDLSVIISPNPTNDFLNIQQQQNHDLKVSVFDISGKYIMQESFNFNEHKMDVRELTKGVYIFYVQDQQTQKTNTYKIIKN